MMAKIQHRPIINTKAEKLRKDFVADVAHHTPGPWIRHLDGCGQVWVDDYAVAWCATRENDEGPNPELFNANAALVALAPTAPHDCDVPDCPGAEAKWFLDRMKDLYPEASDLGDIWMFAQKSEQDLEAYERMSEQDKGKLSTHDKLVGVLEIALKGFHALLTTPLTGPVAAHVAIGIAKDARNRVREALASEEAPNATT